MVEFFYGDPDPALVATVHAAGALAAWQVGSVDEARAAEQAGCDFIVVQGVVIVLVAVAVLVTFLIEIAYMLADPRVRTQRR